MGNYWKIVVAFVAVALLSTVQPACVYACSCATTADPKQAFSDATAVFSGQMTELGTPLQREGLGYVPLTFSVTQAWKGVERSTVILEYSQSHDCDFSFVQGQEYLVYASEYNGRLSAFLCSRTALLADAGEDLAALGPGTVPVEVNAPTTLPTTGDDARSRLVVAVTVAASLIGGGLFLVFRRRASARRS